MSWVPSIPSGVSAAIAPVVILALASSLTATLGEDTKHSKYLTKGMVLVADNPSSIPEEGSRTLATKQALLSPLLLGKVDKPTMNKVDKSSAGPHQMKDTILRIQVSAVPHLEAHQTLRLYVPLLQRGRAGVENPELIAKIAKIKGEDSALGHPEMNQHNLHLMQQQFSPTAINISSLSERGAPCMAPNDDCTGIKCCDYMDLECDKKTKTCVQNCIDLKKNCTRQFMGSECCKGMECVNEKCCKRNGKKCGSGEDCCSGACALSSPSSPGGKCAKQNN